MELNANETKRRKGIHLVRVMMIKVILFMGLPPVIKKTVDAKLRRLIVHSD